MVSDVEEIDEIVILYLDELDEANLSNNTPSTWTWSIYNYLFGL
jgi:hypothetical protein